MVYRTNVGRFSLGDVFFSFGFGFGGRWEFSSRLDLADGRDLGRRTCAQRLEVVVVSLHMNVFRRSAE